MRTTPGALPALAACGVLCLTSGCAGMSGISAKSDNHGGVVVYDTQGLHPIAVGRLDSRGNHYVLPTTEGEIVRGADGMDAIGEALERAAQGHSHRHHHIDAWEWAMSWTIIYLIVILIELATYAAEDTD